MHPVTAATAAVLKVFGNRYEHIDGLRPANQAPEEYDRVIRAVIYGILKQLPMLAQRGLEPNVATSVQHHADVVWLVAYAHAPFCTDPATYWIESLRHATNLALREIRNTDPTTDSVYTSIYRLADGRMSYEDLERYILAVQLQAWIYRLSDSPHRELRSTAALSDVTTVSNEIRRLVVLLTRYSNLVGHDTGQAVARSDIEYAWLTNVQEAARRFNAPEPVSTPA